MQKDQRVKSAADRRQLLELRQRQRRKALLGHHQCASDRPGSGGRQNGKFAETVDSYLYNNVQCVPEKMKPQKQMIIVRKARSYIYIAHSKDSGFFWDALYNLPSELYQITSTKATSFCP